MNEGPEGGRSAAIDTTRRALDPQALGKHVADNNDAFMGDTALSLAKGARIIQDIAQINIQTTKDLDAKLNRLDSESRTLASIATRLEQRDQRSKWDWVTLAVGMAIAAVLAGGGAFFTAKANIKAEDFSRSVQLISQDDDATWCDLANGQIVSASDRSKHCAIHMPNYVEPGGEGQ